jgi:RimJ/RimL family protein N-acetyltransferase
LTDGSAGGSAGAPADGFWLRTAVVDDAEAVTDLFEAVAAEQIWIGTEAGFDRDERIARTRTMYEEPDTFTAYVVGSDGDDGLVGCIGLSTPPSGVAEFGMLLLDGYRGRGLGSALLAAAIERARQRGMHKVALQMWPHNARGRALYEKFGFVDEGRLVRHYRRRNGELWDAVQMALVLDTESPGSSVTLD